MPPKKLVPSKFLNEDPDDFLCDSEFDVNCTPKKEPVERKVDKAVVEVSSNLINANIDKIKKTDVNTEEFWDSHQKWFNVMNQQLQVWKEAYKTMLKDLSDTIDGVQTDYDVFKEHKKMLEQVVVPLMKCVQQSSTAYKQKLKLVKDFRTAFNKNLSDIVDGHQADYDILIENEKKFENRIGSLMKCVQQASTEYEQKQILNKDLHASFKKRTEGLILRGAVQPDDRPLWFDVYKAFPPTVEPKFARPKPVNQSIRPILYKEDVIRAKFHAKGHGLSVNMLSLTGETQTRKLVQKYQELQSEGVPEEELLEKTIKAVESVRHTGEFTKITPKNRDSVTAKFLSETNLKDIFKE